MHHSCHYNYTNGDLCLACLAREGGLIDNINSKSLYWGKSQESIESSNILYAISSSLGETSGYMPVYVLFVLGD
jgi:hypothetical protein